MAGGKTKGHLAALFTVVIWGTTFISTKVLLRSFTTIEILFLRFVMGYIALWILKPEVLKLREMKEELLFLFAGLSGVFLYYFLENTAVSYTLASNVGVITSTAALFSAIIARFTLKEEADALERTFVIGFLIAMAGIALISFNGSELHLNPVGDLLALSSAFTWGIYSVLSKKISDLGYPTVQATRRIFMYGLVFMLPMVFLSGIDVEPSALSNPVNFLNLLFLGFLASAACFVTWNYAVRELGAVMTSVYIYAIPVVTVVFSTLILSEPITLLSGSGTILILIGLVISERK